MIILNDLPQYYWQSMSTTINSCETNITEMSALNLCIILSHGNRSPETESVRHQQKISLLVASHHHYLFYRQKTFSGFYDCYKAYLTRNTMKRPCKEIHMYKTYIKQYINKSQSKNEEQQWKESRHHLKPWLGCSEFSLNPVMPKCVVNLNNL